MTLNIYVAYNSAILLLGIYPSKIKTCLHKDKYINVDSKFIYNSQKVKTTLVSIKNGMNKQVVVFPYNEFTSMGYKGNLGVIEIFYIFKVVVLAPRYKFVKTH